MSDLAAPMTRAEHQAAIAAYAARNEDAALALGNRGPLRLINNRLHPDIVSSYRRHGFYVFENVVGEREIAELHSDLNTLFTRAPRRRGSTTDQFGDPAFGHSFARDTYAWVRPLADPVGGAANSAKHYPAKMAEPLPDAGSPKEVIYMMFGMCQAMASGLRLYGHPKILAAAATLNGSDFTPFNDAIFVKQPGLGGSVAWHQDGITHWDSPLWDEDIHGLNFQLQLHPSTPCNGLWVLPGSHKLGKVDIEAMVAANGGSEQLPGALPAFCNAGDVILFNRQLVHCSFANTSSDPRVSITYGFHKRSAVEQVHSITTNTNTNTDTKRCMNDSLSAPLYDAKRIFERSQVIAVAINARAEHFPDETPFSYQPFQASAHHYALTPTIWEQIIKDYNLKDLSI